MAAGVHEPLENPWQLRPVRELSVVLFFVFFFFFLELGKSSFLLYYVPLTPLEGKCARFVRIETVVHFIFYHELRSQGEKSAPAECDSILWK